MRLLDTVRARRDSARSGRLVLTSVGVALASALLALTGCGSAAGASPRAATSATPTCPPAGNFKSVSGTITATGNNTITVTESTGAQMVVQLTPSTRITKQVTEAPTSIADGTSVLIVSDKNATTAQRISVLASAGGSGFGSGGFGRFGGTGTPGTGRASACFSRTPGAGRAGGSFGSGGTAGSGAGAGFQGLRGTVDAVNDNQIVIDDAEGQTFSLTITSSTVTTATSSGTASDLVTGARVSASGTLSGSQMLKAVMIAVLAAG